MLQGSVREWTRRIAETTLMLQPLSRAERAEAVARASPAPRDRTAAHASRARCRRPRAAGCRRRSAASCACRCCRTSSSTLREHLHATLGPDVRRRGQRRRPTPPPPADAGARCPSTRRTSWPRTRTDALRYDVTVRFPDGDTVVYRVTRMAGGAPLPRNLFINLILLVLILVVGALPRGAQHHAAAVGAGALPPTASAARAGSAQLTERGARELRDAARAFNTMQDRLHRYLDSRTRVLAAMSHDLKTPLTRLRLQVEALDNPPMQERIGHELDEMEGMVREALSLFRGLDDGEPAAAVDIDALLAKVRAGVRRHGRR